MNSERQQTTIDDKLPVGVLLNRDFAEGSYQKIIDDICDLNWSGLTREEIVNTAWTYYYFSVQFCETVGVARRLYPNDARLEELDAGERNTDNLSPCPGVVATGERVDHDEFMRRTLQLELIDPARERRLRAIGEAYLEKVRAVDDKTRVLSLASYEDGGLERTFRAMLQARYWSGPLLFAFRHFLEGHIKLDSDPDHGHGSLCRHLVPSDRVYGLWVAFKESLIAGAPSLVK
ncbi:MAG TPA: hypothetical protein VK446_05880 [Methylocystis sp.]|nr:hypothetical protein [Methylocystis sp.]